MPDPRMNPVGSQYIASGDVETTPTTTDLVEVYDATKTNERKAISIANFLKPAVKGVANGYKVARGVHTTVAASDTVVSGLATVVAVIVSPGSDLSADLCGVTATIGDQAGSPAAGSFYLKSWKPTSTSTTTPVAATAFSKAVNWIAIGT